MRSSPWTTTSTGFRWLFTLLRILPHARGSLPEPRLLRHQQGPGRHRPAGRFRDGDDNPPATHLVLIEAKAYLPWTNKQLKSKTGRLREIFGEGGTQARVVEPHFVLMTGRKSDNIKTATWPGWTKDSEGNPFWLTYDLARRRKVTRCMEGGKPDKCGGHLRLDCVPPSSG